MSPNPTLDIRETFEYVPNTTLDFVIEYVAGGDTFGLVVTGIVDGEFTHRSEFDESRMITVKRPDGKRAYWEGILSEQVNLQVSVGRVCDDTNDFDTPFLVHETYPADTEMWADFGRRQLEIGIETP